MSQIAKAPEQTPDDTGHAAERGKQDNKRINTPDLLAMLRARYPAPEYAFLTNVPDSTGHAGRRRADAVAMSLWPSRGLELIGFELKVSRGDWLREKKAPDKAEAIARYCDRWYLVVSDATIVKPGELPPGWGLIVPRGRSLVLAQEAAALPAQSTDRAFMAALLRAATTNSPSAAEVDAAVKRAVEANTEQWRETMETRIREGDEQISETNKAIKRFEEQSGVRIDRWSHGNIGPIVRAVLDLGRVDFGPIARAHQAVENAGILLREAKEAVGLFTGRLMDGNAKSQVPEPGSDPHGRSTT